jgi:hypothetical protein
MHPAIRAALSLVATRGSQDIRRTMRENLFHQTVGAWSARAFEATLAQ